MFNNRVTPTYTTADRLVNSGPTLVYGWVFDCSADESVLTLYNGQDTGSGEIKFHTEGWNIGANPVILGVPVLFDKGLYVDLGTGVTDCTILWFPDTPALAEIIG
jgi:hypothetical protein